MASNPLHCGICTFRDITKEAVIWCSECDEGLCADCQKHYCISKGTRHHNTLPISEYLNLPTEILKISQFCNIHSERFQLFCKKHDVPCCRNCVVESHNKCEHLANIDDVTNNVKSSHAFLDIKSMIDHVTQNLEQIYQNRKENLLAIQDQKDKIEKDIAIKRKEINDHLDKIQEEMFNELKQTEETEKKKNKDLLQSIEENREKIYQCRIDIEKITQHASNLQTFLAMKQMQSEIAITEEFLESVLQNGETYQTVISIDIIPELLNIPSEIAKFGDIHINRNPCKLNLVRHKANEAQMMIPQLPSRSIDNLTLQLEQTMKNMGKIAGCTMLQDGRMVFSSHLSKRKLLVMKDGSVDFEINLEFQTRDMVKLKDDNVIAATSGNQTKISVIDINKRKVIKTFDVEKNNYGITVKDNTLLYCVEGKGIQQLNLTDTSISDIVKCPLCNDPYITTFGDNIYYTNPLNANTVTCCGIRGKKKWEFNDKSVLFYPCGVSVDQYGNVYVAGRGSHNVIVFSPDGQTVKEILSKNDGLHYPNALYYDQPSNKLLVTDLNCGDTFLFSVN